MYLCSEHLTRMTYGTRGFAHLLADELKKDFFNRLLHLANVRHRAFNKIQCKLQNGVSPFTPLFSSHIAQIVVLHERTRAMIWTFPVEKWQELHQSVFGFLNVLIQESHPLKDQHTFLRHWQG